MTQQPEPLRLADALDSDPSDITGHKAAAELRRLHQSEREGWRYAKELETRITALEAALRQALKDMVWLDNWIGGKPMPECVTRLRKSITAAKQALEGKA